MRRPEFIARQSGCPSGLLGRLIGSIMATETAGANDAVVAALALQPSDCVVEIGFGHGRTLDRVARQLTAGGAAGIDLSETMVRMTARRCRDLIAAGRVTLHQGDSTRLPFPDGHFNKAYSVHTLYFWTHPEDHLREIHRVLCSGGRLALGFHTDEAPGARDFPETVYRFYSQAEVETLLQDAGFSKALLTEPTLHRGFVTAVATRSSVRLARREEVSSEHPEGRRAHPLRRRAAQEGAGRRRARRLRLEGRALSEEMGRAETAPRQAAQRQFSSSFAHHLR